jgi:rare lipoprotein A
MAIPRRALEVGSRPPALLVLALAFFFPLCAAPCARAEEGLASWYGGKFQGRRTANGEIFDTNLFTAAHKTLPFGTYVRVTNVETGQSTIVRINDRGPFVPGRIIDLSRAAATAIGLTGAGVARVRLEIVPPGKDTPPAPRRSYTIQLGAFRTKSYADALHADARAKGFPSQIKQNGEGIYRVVLLNVREEELDELRRRLAEAGWPRTLARLER